MFLPGKMVDLKNYNIFLWTKWHASDRIRAKMENHDLYILGSLDSPKGRTAKEKIHARFPNEERAFNLSDTRIYYDVAIESARRQGIPLSTLDNDLTKYRDEFGRVIEALLDGKVCMDYLISTQGGTMFYWATTGSMFSSIKSNGGTVRTYALERALSLGALNWATGNERFACEDSEFMWHLPQDRTGGMISPESLSEITEVVRSSMAETFESNPNGMHWGRIVRRMNCSEELNLIARDLYQAGFIEKLFKYRREVKAHIANCSPWKFTKDDNDAFLGEQIWYELND